MNNLADEAEPIDESLSINRSEQTNKATESAPLQIIRKGLSSRLEQGDEQAQDDEIHEIGEIGPNTTVSEAFNRK